MQSLVYSDIVRRKFVVGIFFLLKKKRFSTRRPGYGFFLRSDATARTSAAPDDDDDACRVLRGAAMLAPAAFPFGGVRPVSGLSAHRGAAATRVLPASFARRRAYANPPGTRGSARFSHAAEIASSAVAPPPSDLAVSVAVGLRANFPRWFFSWRPSCAYRWIFCGILTLGSFRLWCQ